MWPSPCPRAAGSWSWAGSSSGPGPPRTAPLSVVEVVAEELGPSLGGNGDDDQDDEEPGPLVQLRVSPRGARLL
jgi:hypothetical protein